VTAKKGYLQLVAGNFGLGEERACSGGLVIGVGPVAPPPRNLRTSDGGDTIAEDGPPGGAGSGGLLVRPDQQVGYGSRLHLPVRIEAVQPGEIAQAVRAAQGVYAPITCS
jgi:hypothetical protein